MSGRLALLILLLSATWVCARPNPYQGLLRQLLTGHGHKNVVEDAQGVGLKGQPARLLLKTYGEPQESNNSWSVEMEVKVHLPSGDLVEYVSGAGDTREKAEAACRLNFTMSTFHPLYKAFLNPSDAHVESLRLASGREMIPGDLIFLGVNQAPSGSEALKRKLESLVGKLPFGPGPHTVKLVYSPRVTCSVVVDNREQPECAQAVSKLKWPPGKAWFMAKQFFVIKQAKADR